MKKFVALFEGWNGNHEQKSEYGNRFCKITKEMIESLENEKILMMNDGEYCTFLKYFPD